MTDLWRMTALELGERIGNGEVLPSEVLDAHLTRIADVNGSVNAVTLTLEETARGRARDADDRARRGLRRGPLDGVPFTSKENLDLVGAPTTEGLVAMADNMPALDAPIVERLEAAGAVPFARTNMPDLGLRVHTDNALHAVRPDGEPRKTPSLLGVGSRAPFMHDGCAQRLEDRFTDEECGGGDHHGRTSHLSRDEVFALISFLETL